MLQSHNGKINISEEEPITTTQNNKQNTEWKEPPLATKKKAHTIWFHLYKGQELAGEGNGNPLQDSYLENTTGRGAWQATVHGVTGVGHASAG